MADDGTNAPEHPAPRPHLIEKFHGDPRASGLPCPVLSTLVNEDLLVPDENGEVTVTACKRALARIGVSPALQVALTRLGSDATGTTGRGVIRLLDLEGSALDHKGSLGPLQDGGFNQVFLDRLKSYSRDGKVLTIDDIAAAQRARQDEDNTDPAGRAIGYAEVAGLLLVFGQKTSSGKLALSLDALDCLFKRNLLPKGFKPHRVGPLMVAATATQLAMKQMGPKRRPPRD